MIELVLLLIGKTLLIWMENSSCNGTKMHLQFTIDVKKELRQYQLQKLKDMQQQYPNLLLVVDRLFSHKRRLRKIGIPYVETNGNVFIRTEELFLFIDTNKTKKNTKQEAIGLSPKPV